MPRGTFCLRLTLLTTAAWLPGLSCYRPPPPVSAPEREAIAGESGPLLKLQARVDQVLARTFESRRLDRRTHGAWQVLHGILAYGRSFPLVLATGEQAPAVDYLLQGGALDGWTFEAGELLPDGRRGLRAIVEAGTKRGQGHADQWLAILAQCDLPREQIIRWGDREFTVGDYLAQVQRDVPRNLDREWSWTLIGLSHYLPSDAKWTAGDGKSWTLEGLVGLEAQQELDSSACGGTHRLIGLAMALHAHDQQHGNATPNWNLARQVVADAVTRARTLQNGDGSFSSHYLARGGQTLDLAQDLGCTGHVLEFLSLTLPPEELRQPWVARAVAHLCDTIDRTAHVDLECGALYHAVHGLVLYRQRALGDAGDASPDEASPDDGSPESD